MATATWRGAVVAQSDDTVIVEGNHYFPPGSVNWELLTPSSHESVCGWKGTASYYDLTVAGETNPNAVWQYRDPMPAAAGIKDRVAFWHGVQVDPGEGATAGPVPPTGLER